MKNKVWRTPITIFVLRFALIFGLLIFPWPGWNDIYSHYFESLGEAAFSRDDTRRVVLFTPEEDAVRSAGLDLQITLANRDLLDSTGKSLMKKTGLNTRSIGWVPTALTVALITATPIPWRRRAGALAGGLILVHGFILFSLQVWIWNNSPELSLLSLSEVAKKVTDGLEYTLINQLGASFAVPVLIWILVAFNGRDIAKFRPHQEGTNERRK